MGLVGATWRPELPGGLLWPLLPNVIYTFSISVVAAFLFAAINEIEPNRRYASVLKFLIVFVSVAAIAGRLMP